MKHDTFDKYPPYGMELPTQALLTTWDCLPDCRADLVLVGGLAVRYLTKLPVLGMPGAVTLDVDFGVNIAAGGGAYPVIREHLSAHGFQWVNSRFSRKFPKMELHIDLLTDDDRSDAGSVILDDGLSVGIFPGINRALACYRIVSVAGATLLGRPLTENIKLAEVGPLLALQLNAFGGPGGRKPPKDAHDVLYLAEIYLGGTAAAVTGFREDRRTGNRGINPALQCLKRFFSGPESQSSLACAPFRLNNLHLKPQNADASLQIRQQFVTLTRNCLRKMSEYLHVEKPSFYQLAMLGWVVVDQGQGGHPPDAAPIFRNDVLWRCSVSPSWGG